MTLVQQVLEAMGMSEGLNDPSIFKAIFLAGGPGSGKSYVTKNTVGGFGLKLVNTDKAFEKFLKDAGKSLKIDKLSDKEQAEVDAIRARAKSITGKQEKNYIEGRLGLILDGTGKKYSKMVKYKKTLEQLGYDTAMVFVDTAFPVSMKRNRERERSVGIDVVTSSWRDVQKNKKPFKTLFGDDFHIVNTTEQILPRKGSSSKVFVDIFKAIKKFTAKPVTNPKAKDWIKGEKERRGLK